FDLATGQFPPAFDRTHVAALGIAREKIARLLARLLARQLEGFAQVTVGRLGPSGHSSSEVARANGHLESSNAATTLKYRDAGDPMSALFGPSVRAAAGLGLWLCGCRRLGRCGLGRIGGPHAAPGIVRALGVRDLLQRFLVGLVPLLFGLDLIGRL